MLTMADDRAALGCISQAEPKLEQPRLPSRARSELARPDVQISTDARNFVLPHAIHRRREELCIVCRDTREGGVEYLEYGVHRLCCNRHFPLLQGAKELSQHLMKQSPLCKRIHALQRLRLLQRSQAIHRR